MTKEEYCAGVIPLRLTKERGWEILLALHVKGDYWAFPKGHLNSQESPYSAAERELQEELNLKIDRLYDHAPLKEDYLFEREGKKIHKHVTYYPAFVKGDLVLNEPYEVKEVCWISIQEGLNQVTFNGTRKMLEPLIQSLSLNTE